MTISETVRQAQETLAAMSEGELHQELLDMDVGIALGRVRMATGGLLAEKSRRVMPGGRRGNRIG